MSDEHLMDQEPQPRRRLGRGLSSLLGRGTPADAEVTGTDQATLHHLSIDGFERNPWQPRKDFDAESMRELADSIREHGILQPLLVRELPDGGFQLIAGERRWQAARLAGLTSVPCRIVDVIDQTACEYALEENLKRKDLNDLEKAKAFRDYLNHFGATIEELSKQLSMSRPAVSNMLRLLELPEPVQAALHQGKISAGHARSLLKLDEASQLAMCGRIQAESLNVRETEAAVKQSLNPPSADESAADIVPMTPPESSKKPQPSNHILSVQDHLRGLLGVKVEIKLSADDRGQIVIPFGSGDEFESVMRNSAARPRDRMLLGFDFLKICPNLDRADGVTLRVIHCVSTTRISGIFCVYGTSAMPGLIEFGWTDDLAGHFAGLEDWIPARVTEEHRSGYRVQTQTGEHSARLSGRLRHEAIESADRPAVGDWVAVQSAMDEGDCTIHRLLPRKSRFSRRAAGERTEEQIVAANVDTVWIVTALDQDFSLRRIERYLTLAWESGAIPAVILTKADLSEDAGRQLQEVESVAMGVQVHLTSSLTQTGVVELQRYFQNHATVALLGSSGVGKSTLINVLAGRSLRQTGDVRSDGKGRHTTTQRQLIRLPGGGLIIDTPGMRELQLWDSESGLAETFGDIEQLAKQCRFSDCSHASEPGCAVLDAVTQGQLSEERLLSHQKLQRELAHLERKQDARARAEEKRRTKVISKTLRDHPKYKR